jgi:hypothetical protein
VADAKERAERVRVLLEEFGEFIAEIEAECVATWKEGATPDDREEAWRDWRAVQRLRRKLDNVLRTDTLERLQHERQTKR